MKLQSIQTKLTEVRFGENEAKQWKKGISFKKKKLKLRNKNFGVEWLGPE